MQIAAFTTAILASGLFFVSPSSPAKLFDQHSKTGLQPHIVQIASINTKTEAAPAQTAPQPTPTNVVPTPAVSPQTITVQLGDNLTKLAGIYNTTALRLYYANTAIENPDLIHAGQILNIPAPDEQLVPRPVPTTQPSTQPAASAISAPYRQYPIVGAISSNTSIWDRIAACESGGNWSINTGNGYYGGLQFNLASWRGVGGNGLPSDASKTEQIARGQMLQAKQGWGSWPVCSRQAGLL